MDATEVVRKEQGIGRFSLRETDELGKVSLLRTYPGGIGATHPFEDIHESGCRAEQIRWIEGILEAAGNFSRIQAH